MSFFGGVMLSAVLPLGAAPGVQDPAARLAEVRSLAQDASPEATARLADALYDADPKVQREATRILKERSWDPSGTQIALLLDTPNYKYWGLQLLGKRVGREPAFLDEAFRRRLEDLLGEKKGGWNLVLDIFEKGGALPGKTLLVPLVDHPDI